MVSTGVLKPYQAVLWAAFFNFVAILLFELKVAATVGKGIVDPGVVEEPRQDHVAVVDPAQQRLPDGLGE